MFVLQVRFASMGFVRSIAPKDKLSVAENVSTRIQTVFIAVLEAYASALVAAESARVEKSATVAFAS